MQIIKTSIPDILLIEHRIQSDSRGYFMELFQSERLQESLAHSCRTIFRDRRRGS